MSLFSKEFQKTKKDLDYLFYGNILQYEFTHKRRLIEGNVIVENFRHLARISSFLPRWKFYHLVLKSVDFEDFLSCLFLFNSRTITLPSSCKNSLGVFSLSATDFSTQFL